MGVDFSEESSTRILLLGVFEAIYTSIYWCESCTVSFPSEIIASLILNCKTVQSSPKVETSIDESLVREVPFLSHENVRWNGHFLSLSSFAPSLTPRYPFTAWQTERGLPETGVSVPRSRDLYLRRLATMPSTFSKEAIDAWMLWFPPESISRSSSTVSMSYLIVLEIPAYG